MKSRLVDLIGSSGIENATSAQPKNLADSPPVCSLGEWLGTRLVPSSYALTRGGYRVPGRANFFFGLTFDLENFPTSRVKGRILLEATPP